MAKHGSGPLEVIAVDAGIDRLFQGPLEHFTTGRNALAARLKAAGRRDDAERVRALAKPGLPSWAVNQVYWHASDVFDRLLRAGDRLRDAQLAGLKGSSSDVAQAALARQQAIDAVVERAMRFVTDAGSPASSTTQQRVAVAADALAAYGTLPNRPPAGRLSGDLDPPGFGLLAALVPAGVLGQAGMRETSSGAQETGAQGHRGTGAKTGAQETGAQGHRGTGRGRGGRAVGDNGRERHEALERARFEAARADAELRRRRSEQERATREVERAAARLASAEDAERRAREALATAARAVTEARAAHGDAASRASEARNATVEAEHEAGEAKRRLRGLE